MIKDWIKNTIIVIICVISLIGIGIFILMLFIIVGIWSIILSITRIFWKEDIKNIKK